jgi:hypothetical protein
MGSNVLGKAGMDKDVWVGLEWILRMFVSGLEWIVMFRSDGLEWIRINSRPC